MLLNQIWCICSSYLIPVESVHKSSKTNQFPVLTMPALISHFNFIVAIGNVLSSAKSVGRDPCQEGVLINFISS